MLNDPSKVSLSGIPKIYFQMLLHFLETFTEIKVIMYIVIQIYTVYLHIIYTLYKRSSKVSFFKCSVIGAKIYIFNSITY